MASSKCFTTSQESGFIQTLGVAMLLMALYSASINEGSPLDQLGNRSSKGKGLFSYLYYHLFDDRTGVIGFDPIQGALSPPLRIAIHTSLILLLWSFLLILWPISFIPNVKCFVGLSSLAFCQSGFSVVLTYLFTLYAVHTWLPGVSQPAGPRDHRIQRQPKWDDKYHALPNITSDGKQLPSSAKFAWSCVVAQESHKASDTAFAGTAAALTGEPAGRDVWTTASSPKTAAANADESLVQEIAAGGRRPGEFNPSINPNSCDMTFRAQMIRNYLTGSKQNKAPEKSPCRTVQQALRKAVHFYSMLQTDDGHWSGDYGGPMFLMPGLIVVWYVMGKPKQMLSKGEIALMKHYMTVHQQTDGGWGTHIESPSTMFGTTLNYVALRLLGVEKDDPMLVRGRAFIKEQGGAIMTSSWAKFYLCLLGCMHWDGHNSVPPEMWLLPNWFPFHPGRLWCHARMVYLPMGYVYGARIVYDKAETDPIVLSLREELYCQSYDSIPWIKTRHMVADMDNYSPIPWVMKTLQNILARYETWPIFQPLKNYVRKLGLDFCLDYMAAEDLQTNFIDIGPVNKVLNMLSAYHAVEGDINHTTVMNHMARVSDYLWLAEDGLKMKGYNGSQCWDTSFAVQAIYEAGFLDEFPDMTKKVWSYLERCQILSTDVSQGTPAFKFENAASRRKYYRHLSQGGWPFSTSAHGWPISDCTGEGLKATLCLMKSKVVSDCLKESNLNPISEERLRSAANILLTYQNEDGGWATYENNRGFGWYESLNPSEVFGDIMIDYSYVECSMASLTALVDFHESYPSYRSDEIKASIDQGRNFIKSLQREDGSWYGSWACCFCYGGWFGIEGLVKSGEPKSSPTIKKSCEFLLKHQRANGGWGEDFTSCYDKDYAANGMEAYGDKGSGVVNTAWALLALAACECDDVAAVRKGVQYLMERQLPYGDWPQEGIAGVFNRTCGITYTAYRNVFPIWALGRCCEVYGSKIDN